MARSSVGILRNLIVYAALGLTLLGMLMTGSRGPVLMLVLLLPLYRWLSLARESDLLVRLQEYLPAGMEIGIVYQT